MSIVYVSSCNQILLYCINYSSTRFVSLLFSVLLDHTLREVLILLNSMLIQRTYVLGQEVRVMRRYVFLQNFPFSLELFSVLLCIFVFVFICYHFQSFTFLSFSPSPFFHFFSSLVILPLYILKLCTDGWKLCSSHFTHRKSQRIRMFSGTRNN